MLRLVRTIVMFCGKCSDNRAALVYRDIVVALASVGMTASGMTARFAQLLGSIKLAVPLLVAIAAILIGATFYESEVGSTVVQQEIYKSPWFGGLMFLLAVNLGTSTLLRYPWKGARKIGFAITHWGLVVIIAGSAAVIHLSVEGMLLARTDAGPVSTLRVEGDLVEVAAPGEQMAQTSLFIKNDGTVVPSRIGELSLLSYSDNTMKTVRFEEGGGVENPAVRLALTSERMGQSLERWLAVAPAAYGTMDVGPAELQLFKANDEAALSELLAAPREQAEAATWGTLDVAWRSRTESIDVFQSLQQPLSQQPLSIESKGQTLSVEVKDFWPDFRLDGNRQPTTASDALNNPAVQLIVSTDDAQESWFIFGNEGFEPIRTPIAGEPIAAEVTYQISTVRAPDAFFRVVADADNHLYYAAKSSKGFKSGELAVGDSVTPGWADFQVTLAEYVPHAEVKREIVPLPKEMPGEGEPALLVATNQAGAQGEPVWIPWGEPTTISSAAGDWFVSFSPKLLKLPFGLQLNDFIVERNEGSESVAMWTSAVSLLDPFAATPEAAKTDRRVWMNHPTWFKGWKIAQASWNPGDLNQSTLQVKREPWWVTGLTWLGSLMVTVGVSTMFYGRAIAKKFKKASTLMSASDLPSGSSFESSSGASSEPSSEPSAGQTTAEVEEETTVTSIPLFEAFSGVFSGR
ncbi:MAG: cytochrome c biogenesis protein ResB [Phormidesmis sp.]